MRLTCPVPFGCKVRASSEMGIGIGVPDDLAARYRPDPRAGAKGLIALHAAQRAAKGGAQHA